MKLHENSGHKIKQIQIAYWTIHKYQTVSLKEKLYLIVLMFIPRIRILTNYIHI